MNNGVTQMTPELLPEPKPSTLGLPRISMLTKDDPVAWMLMPEFLQRVKQFCLTEDADSDGELLTKWIVRDFAADEHNFGLMVGVKDGLVVGHLLASIDYWFEKKYVTVLQYRWDKKLGVSRGLIQAGFDMLSEWGNLNMCRELQALVPTEAHERRLRMLYGFHRHKILMRKEI